jgi:hypothetical protein
VVISTLQPHFTPRNIIKIAMYRRLGGPQGRSGRVENLIPTRAQSQTFQPVVSCCTDSATQPTMTLVASPNRIGSHIEFIFRGSSFIYIMNNRGSRIDPLELHVSTYPSHRKKFSAVLGDFN